MSAVPVHSLSQAGVDCLFLRGGRAGLSRAGQPIRESGGDEKYERSLLHCACQKKMGGLDLV